MANQAYQLTVENGGELTLVISDRGVSTPATHASTHITGGSDAIQLATNARPGLASAAHITAIEANTAKTSNATHTGDVTGATALTIANNAVTTAKILDGAVTFAKVATQPKGQLSMVANSTATTIAVADTYYKMLGTTTLDSSTDSEITSPASNRLTYTGATTRIFQVVASADCQVADGGTPKDVGIKIAKNGTPIDATEASGYTTVKGSLTMIKCRTSWMIELAQNDYIEIFLANIDTTDSITAVNARLTAFALL